MQLERVQSPECPRCSCNATSLVGAGETHGRAWARFACDFCDAEFSIGSVPRESKTVNGVVWKKIRCPRCNSNRCPVKTTRGVKRYHKCENCGQNFKSLEM